EKAPSDAYFEGGYWLQLWQFLYGAGVSLVLLQTRLSARMRDFAARSTRFKSGSRNWYAIQFILLISVMTLPLSVYRSNLASIANCSRAQSRSGFSSTTRAVRRAFGRRCAGKLRIWIRADELRI